ncbi:haloacid dehalogenase [Pseudodesulfovibrio nedwellii]|uniref:phosphoglycolate phosphatase n=1 Tax=Pseudodesulfovibrio nedwellii TaxID=2973072 RepID=A0ABN6S179_9BACT|nr:MULTISPECIES: HAD-IA family hydrolase [Pseudodesulfovibrio]BDQ36038.1 haloacid dehalogenase [Pseudodesulfovibrio nedwellii]
MALANEIMNPDILGGLKTIVFDCDGVLIDSYEANMHYYGTIRKELGLPPLSDEEKYYVHTRTHKEAVTRIVPEDLFDEAWKLVKAFDSSSLHQYLKRSDGVREFLWWLRDAGFGLAVNTSRGDTMDGILTMMDLEGFFYPVMTSDKVCVPKPHPEGIFTIMREHSVQPHEVAYIGDSIVDEKTARAAGVRFWAYKDANMTAEVHIDDFWAIKAAMQRCYKGRRQSF